MDVPTLVRSWVKPACYFAGLMCLLALLPLPMASFVPVARLIAFAAATLAVVAAWNQGQVVGVLVFIGIGVFMNPIAPVLFERPYWMGATFLCAVLFLFAASRLAIPPVASGETEATP